MRHQKHMTADAWLTCAQYARRVPQGGHSFHEPLHQYAHLPRGTPFISLTTSPEPDKKEFIRISQAVGIGFLIMGEWRPHAKDDSKFSALTGTAGVIGYIVKLVHIPVNNILVGGS
jgi:protein transport protein SEC61 subunit gamma-like protein